MRAASALIRDASPARPGSQITAVSIARWRRILSAVRGGLFRCLHNAGVTDTKQLKVLTRMAVAHAATVSVIEFDSRKFLVGTTAKGQISLLLIDIAQITPPRIIPRRGGTATNRSVRSSNRQLKATQ